MMGYFIAWMILYPIGNVIFTLLVKISDSIEGSKASDNARFHAAVIRLIIYVSVAVSIWDKI